MATSHAHWAPLGLARRPHSTPHDSRAHAAVKAALMALVMLGAGLWLASHTDWTVPAAVPSAVPAPDKLPPTRGTLMPNAGPAPAATPR